MNSPEVFHESRGEKAIGRHLDEQWTGERFVVKRHCRPLDILQVPQGDLTAEEHSFLMKSEFDFTLLEQATRKPLLSIEFDGFGGGFSRGESYISSRRDVRPDRKWRLELKLRVATRCNYPLVVIAGDESAMIRGRLRLTIVDGIIGRVLAYKSLSEKMQDPSFVDDVPECGDQDVRHEWIQNRVLDAETDALIDFDPITVKIMELSRHVKYKFSHEDVWVDPPAPDFDPENPDIEKFGARLRALDEAVWVYAKRTYSAVNTTASKTVRVRNVRGVVSTLSLAQAIAELLALDALRKNEARARRRAESRQVG